MGIYPALTLVLWLAGPTIQDWLIMTAVLVPLMVNVLLPALNRLLAPVAPTKGRLRMRIRRLLLPLTVFCCLAPQAAFGAEALPEPHSSCESEPTRVSTEGTAVSQLTVVNNTDATFGLYWLNYDGERVFYQDAPPHTSQVQPTWLTHPWILADEDGQCYLLIVITSQRQTMTIGSTTGEEPVTPIETTVPATTTTTTGGTQPANPTTTQVGQDGEAPGFPTPLVVGALAMMGVLVGVLAAQGRFSRPKGPGNKDR